MRTWALGTVMVGIMLVATADTPAQTSFVYQGQVKVRGQSFEGVGLFKFAIYTKEGPTEHYLWFNDGDTTQTQPINPVAIDVLDGIFTVLIGDTSLPNMAELEPSIFNIRHPLFLRVWFDDGVHGFEVLSPDSPITNADLLGQKQEKDVTMYVDGAKGNNFWPGLKPSKPKRTIQAAFDALPPSIEGQALIQVADGFYPELVRVQNIQLSGRNASLTLRGNKTTPSQVRLSGAGTPEATTPTRSRALEVINQAQTLVVEGIQIDYCSEYGVMVERSSVAFGNVCIRDCPYLGALIQRASTATFQNAAILSCGRGINSTSSSQTTLSDSEVANMDYWGVMAGSSGQAYLIRSQVHHTGQCNLMATAGAIASVIDSELYSGGTVGSGAYFGIRADAGSVIRVQGANVHDQTIGGVLSMLNSTVYFYGSASTIRNCPVGVDAHSAGLIHNQDGVYITFTSNGQNVVTGGQGNYLIMNY